MFVTIPFTHDFALEAAKQSYQDFSSYKLVPYTKEIIARVLENKEAIKDLKRATWRFKQENFNRKAGLGEKYVETMQKNALASEINLSQEECRALLALGVSADGEHWQTGTFGMSWKLLEILFQAHGFTIMPNYALHLRDKKITESEQEARYNISYEIFSNTIADTTESSPKVAETTLVRQTATFVVTKNADTYNIDINDTKNILEIDKTFFVEKLLPRVKENFAAKDTPLDAKDFFIYVPFLQDEGFTKTFLQNMMKMRFDSFMQAIHYIELCFRHNPLRRQEIFDQIFMLLSANQDMSVFQLEMTKSELQHAIQLSNCDKAQKKAAKEILNQINKLTTLEVHENLDSYTHILHSTATLMRDPSNMEAFLRYEEIILTVNHDSHHRLMRAAMITLLGIAIITFTGGIISAALAMPPVAAVFGIMMSAELIIKVSLIVGGLLGIGASGMGIYNMSTNKKPLDNITKTCASFWNRTYTLINKGILNSPVPVEHTTAPKM